MMSPQDARHITALISEISTKGDDAENRELQEILTGCYDTSIMLEMVIELRERMELRLDEELKQGVRYIRGLGIYR